MSPKVPGRNYYEQKSPSKRGFKNRGFYVHESYLADLEKDAEDAGQPSVAAYLRHLWDEDRRRRGLEPRPHEGSKDQTAD